MNKANKWTGLNVTVVQHTVTQPFDIKILHPSRQPKGKNNFVYQLKIKKNLSNLFNLLKFVIISDVVRGECVRGFLPQNKNHFYSG